MFIWNLMILVYFPRQVSYWTWFFNGIVEWYFGIYYIFFNFQHAMLLPVLVCHLRFHRSLQILEDNINYKFKNRYLLQLAMTHPSFR